MAPKINPNEYVFPAGNITLEQLKSAFEQTIKVFGVPIQKSEIWKNGIVAVIAQGKTGSKKIKAECYAKIDKRNIRIKVNHNLNIKKILRIPDPRHSTEDDSAIFLEFWDRLLQKLGLKGREDIGDPINWDSENISEQTQPQQNMTQIEETKSAATAKSFISTTNMKTPSAQTTEFSINNQYDNLVNNQYDNSKKVFGNSEFNPITNTITDTATNIATNITTKPKISMSTFSNQQQKQLQQQENLSNYEISETIKENINPFLIDQLGPSPYYWKLERTATVSPRILIQTIQINLTVDGWIETTPPKVPQELFSYAAKRKIGQHKTTLAFVAGEKAGYVYMRIIGKKLNLEKVYSPDIRTLDPNKSIAAYYVSLLDKVAKDLNIPRRTDFGSGKDLEKEKTIQSIKEQQFNIISTIIVEQLKNQINSDPWFKRYVSQVDPDSNRNLADFMFIRQTIEKERPWTLSNALTLKLVMKNYQSPIALVMVDQVDIKSAQLFPAMISIAIIAPHFIAREISCSFKGIWMPKDIDDETSQQMIYRLNNEYPGLDREFKNIFSEESAAVYKDYEIAPNKKGKKKERIPVENTIHEPIIIRNVEDEFEQLRSILVLSYFLGKPSQNYQGLKPLSQIFKYFEELLASLSKYYVKTEREEKEELRKKEEKKVVEQRSTLNKCPKCGWILSPGKTKCPMCGFDNLDSKMSTSEFSASLAVKGTMESAKTEKLIGALDSILDELDEETEEAQTKFQIKIEKMITNDQEAKILVENINMDSDFVKNNYALLYQKLDDDLNLKLRPFRFIEISTKELTYPWVVLIESLVKEDYTNYHVPVVSYLTSTPAIPSIIRLKAEIDSEQNIKKFRWYADGEDWGLTQKLNSDEFLEFVTVVFGGEKQKYASHFQAKRRDPIGRLIEIEGMEYELPYVIEIRPFYDPNFENKNLLILHQFLKSEAEEYDGAIPLHDILVLIDAVISGIHMVMPKEEIDKTLSEIQSGEDSILGITNEEESNIQDDKKPSMSSSGLFDDLNAEMDSLFEDSDEEELDLSNIQTETQVAQYTDYQQTEPNYQQPTTNQKQTEIQNASFDDLLGSLSAAPSIKQAQTIIPQELAQQCLNYEIDPNMTLEQIEQKEKEIQYQMQSMQDMLVQAQNAYSINQITYEQYNQQEQQINSFIQKFQYQLQLCQQLKPYKGTII